MLKQLLYILKFPWVRNVLKIFFTLLFFYLIGRAVPFEEIKREIVEADLFYLFLALLFLIGRVPFMAGRWMILLMAKGKKCSISLLIKYYFVGFFFNNFLPTSIGGDVVRVLGLTHQHIEKRIAFSSVVLERFLGIFALLIIAIVSFPISRTYSDLWQGEILSSIGLVMVIGSVICAVFFFVPFLIGRRRSQFVSSRICSIIDEFNDYWDNLINLFFALILTIFCQLAGIFSVYLVALSVGEAVPFVFFTFLLPVIWIACMVPITISGLGVREGSFLFLFGVVGMNADVAIAISVLWLFLTYGQSLLGGIFYVFDRSYQEV